MAVDLESKSTADLQTIVANCKRLNQTDSPRFIAARQILEQRRTGDYNIEKSIAAIRHYGERGKFLCYKDIADASGLNWARSRRAVGPHLDAVCIYTESKEWPLLTAIVVHKDKLDSGEMTPENLKGFIQAAIEAGRPIDVDEATFVKREQKRVFAWCQNEQ